MKRKSIVVLLVCFMTMSLSACGGAPDEGKADEKKIEATAPEPKEEEKEEESTSGKVEQINIDNAEGTMIYSKHELTTDYDGAPAIRIYFNYTNKSDETKSAQSTFYPQVFQNGVEGEFTMGNLEEANEASDNLSKELQKGTTLEVAFIYKVQDNENPITLKVNDQSAENFIKGIYQEQELAIQ